MSNKPPLSDFLTALPAMLQAMSQRVLRALLALVARVAKLASDIATAVANFLVRTGKWIWHVYCRLELSIVDALSFVLITVWSLRLFALLLAPAVLLAFFHYWIAGAVYVAVLGIAIWRFYTAKAGEVETAAEDQAPVRALLNKLLGWGLRAVLLALSFVTATLFISSSTSGTTAFLLDQWSRVRSHVADSGSVTGGTPTTTKNTGAMPSEKSSPGGPVRRPSPPQATPTTYGPLVPPSPNGPVAPIQAVTIDLDRVYAANHQSVAETLAKARGNPSAEIESAAKLAARNFDFVAALSSVTRDRKAARPLNDEARAMFALIGDDQDPARYRQVVATQRRAFTADPADIEIAGNLAMYLLRAGDPESAHKYAIYAMSLPRAKESTGRTADWTTIAAALASRGDQEGAANALFVTLSISTDIKKRCEVAVQATRRTYGPVLRPATEAMVQRVRERQLSDAPECALPIAW